MVSGNWSRRSILTVALLLWAAPVCAQEELDVSKIRLGPAPCTLLTGAGSPEGVVTGRVCDIYVRTDGTSATTIIYLKTSSGTTGWLAPGGVSGTGTANYLAKWTGTTDLGNSVVYESGGNLGLGTTTTTYKVTAGGTIAPATGYTYDLGAYLKKWLTVHAAELRVETLVATDTMATIGGRINVAPTTQLTADLAAAATTISVKDNILAYGDIVRLEANGNVEWMAVTQSPQGSGPYTHTVTRNLDGSGANDWYAGDAVLNTGTTGDGYIDLYSDHSTRSAVQYGPSIVGNVRTGTVYSDLEERWAIGNLNGVFGYSTTTYGAAFGSPTGAWLKVDPTNGVRLGYNTTTNVQIEADGDASFTGSITLNTPAVWTASDALKFAPPAAYGGGTDDLFGLGAWATGNVRYVALENVIDEATTADKGAQVWLYAQGWDVGTASAATWAYLILSSAPDVSPTVTLGGDVYASGLLSSTNLILTGKQTYTITGNVSDLSVNTNAQLYYVTNTSGSARYIYSFSINNAVPPDGRILWVCNATASTSFVYLEHDASGTAAYRMYLYNNSALELQEGGCAQLRYDAGLSRWFQINK